MDRTIQDLKPNHDVSGANAISYSYNYAVSKPDIGATEKEHILGLCSVIKALEERVEQQERQANELAAHVMQFRKEAETIRGYRMPHPWRCLEIMLASADVDSAVSLAAHDAALLRSVGESITVDLDSDHMISAEDVYGRICDRADAIERGDA